MNTLVHPRREALAHGEALNCLMISSCSRYTVTIRRYPNTCVHQRARRRPKKTADGWVSGYCIEAAATP